MGSDDDCEEVINAGIAQQQQAILPAARQAQDEEALSQPLTLGPVDAIHHTVQVQCRLPGYLAASNISGCQCYFGDQVVSGTLDPSGALVCYAPPPKPCRGRYAQEKSCQLNVVVSGQVVASSTFQYTALPFWRKPSLEGRLSGRLPTKEDERRLAEECRLVAPLLGGTCAGRGERSMSSLAKLARAIARGRVRQHCEEREHKIQLLQQHIMRLEAALCGASSGQGLLPSNAGSMAALSAANATLHDELSLLGNQMNAKDDELAELRRQLRLQEQLWSDMAKGSCCASALTPPNGTSAQAPPDSSCPTPASSTDAAAATTGAAASGAAKGLQKGGSAGGPPGKRQRQQKQDQQQQQQQTPQAVHMQQQVLMQQLCGRGAPCGAGAAMAAAPARGEGGCYSWAGVSNASNAQPAASLPLFDPLLTSLPGIKELGNMSIPMSFPGFAGMPPGTDPQAHLMQQLHARSSQLPQLFPFAGPPVPNLQAPAPAALLNPATMQPQQQQQPTWGQASASAGLAAACVPDPSMTSCMTGCAPPASTGSGSCCSKGQAAAHQLQPPPQQQQQHQRVGLPVPELPRGPTPETGDSVLDPNVCCFGLIDCSGDDQQFGQCTPEQPQQVPQQQQQQLPHQHIPRQQHLVQQQQHQQLPHQQQRQQQLPSRSMPPPQPMQPPPSSTLNQDQPLSHTQSGALPTPLTHPISSVPSSTPPQGAAGDPGLIHTLVSSLASAQKRLEQLQEMQAQQARAHQEQQSQLIMLHQRLGSQHTNPALVRAVGMPASHQQHQKQQQPTGAAHGGRVGSMTWAPDDVQIGGGSEGDGEPDDFSKLWMN